MAIFKCKMCGASLDIVEGSTVCQCEYCMTKQTLPKLTDEKRANLYDRANHFRRNNEFDKAMSIYEKILNEDSTDAEAYWSLILCNYGIEYVEDPATKRRLPTVNRTQYTSIFDDENYKSAIENADFAQKSIYESEAKAINEIQKGILAISQKEKPFDVFICYKETDTNGRRTPDSVLAQELYYGLKNEGFNVFFSRITLEDKLGSAYEPYIFAALNSAKVMVVLGTRQEHFNAVWVKNEWSRYLSLIKHGEKKTLIPAYRDMDPYDLPEEFSHLQAQDMSKLGFMQDLVRGVKKIINTKETPTASANTNVAPLLERVFMFLEDGDWASANEYCEKVLDIEPKNALAYLGKLMTELRAKNPEQLKKCAQPFDSNLNYQKIVRFGDEKLKKTLQDDIEYIKARNEKAHLESLYNNARKAMSSAISESDYKSVAQKFEAISKYQDSATLAKTCYENAESARIKREEEEAARREQERLKREAEEKARQEQERLKREAEEKARQERERLKREAEEKARQEQERLKREAEEKARKAEEEKKKCEELFKEYKVALKNERVNAIQEETASLIAEHSNLGVFEIKRKKEIKEKLEVLNSERQCLENALLDANQYFGGKLNAFRTSKTVRNELSTFDFGKELLCAFDALLNAKKGDCVKFGSFKQDDNNVNGKEPIEWQVLDVKDGKKLLISKYALFPMTYHTSFTSVTWETCSLRKWLNNDFINLAFNADERSMIPTVTVSADRNPRYSTNPGNSTQDKVFLLSIPEVKKYFGSNVERQCKPTKYRIEYSRVDKSVFGGGNCWWWLRSPSGGNPYRVAYVDFYGVINGRGLSGYFHANSVRPALWIQL